jgi:hypothetical protein
LSGNLVIPATVTTIESGVFFGCTDLASIKVKWTNPSTVTVNNKYPDGFLPAALPKLYIPTGSVNAYKAAGWDSSGGVIGWPNWSYPGSVQEQN